ncbi:J domain-containing protein [Streptomyces roseoverticillatus]|uniref:J domain-containing protein n=1 Tax=Streptomyces roseoverticillatus TaxID=66429 RepID=UPI001F2B4F40|nr:J domain-containing protein [Streptomyces roseoverticillatus]MCF3102600.1 J domain-containing protein [Streptomyces roseoverticillatus]
MTEERRRRTLLIEGYHREFAAISARNPLSSDRATTLYFELADSGPDDCSKLRRIYRKAAARRHPDRAGGDHQVFQLLQEAYRHFKDLEDLGL